MLEFKKQYWCGVSKECCPEVALSKARLHASASKANKAYGKAIAFMLISFVAHSFTSFNIYISTFLCLLVALTGENIKPQLGYSTVSVRSGVCAALMILFNQLHIFSFNALL